MEYEYKKQGFINLFQGFGMQKLSSEFQWYGEDWGLWYDQTCL